MCILVENAEEVAYLTAHGHWTKEPGEGSCVASIGPPWRQPKGNPLASSILFSSLLSTSAGRFGDVCTRTIRPIRQTMSFLPLLKSLGEKLVPVGYENAAGFHFGDAMTVHWEPPRGLDLWLILHDALNNCDCPKGSVNCQNIPPMHGHGLSLLDDEDEGVRFICHSLRSIPSRVVFYRARRRSALR